MVYFRERHLLASNSNPDIFTDSEPYEDVLVNKHYTKEAFYWIQDDFFDPYSFEATAVALYDSKTNKTDKVVVMLELGELRKGKEVHRPVQRQVLEYLPENAIHPTAWEAEEVLKVGDSDLIPGGVPLLELRGGGMKIRLPLFKAGILVQNFVDLEFPEVYPEMPANPSHAEPLLFTSASEF